MTLRLSASFRRGCAPDRAATSSRSFRRHSRSSRQPPSPVGRAVAATIAAAVCGALAWACLGHVDVIATAQGKIIPTGRTKVIQPLDTGMVRAIRVRTATAWSPARC